VAVDTQNAILGVALVSLGEELLSHAPSAHLEVLVVAEGAEGNGIGQALVTEAETIARERGALSMTLHVFATNTRARQVYERLGYTGELIRYIKYLR
jgi:ribosomal protein S18 acetylase RimI-like enzyme